MSDTTRLVKEIQKDYCLECAEGHKKCIEQYKKACAELNVALTKKTQECTQLQQEVKEVSKLHALLESAREQIRGLMHGKKS